MEENSQPPDLILKIRRQIARDVSNYFSQWGNPLSLEMLSRPHSKIVRRVFPDGLSAFLDEMAEAGEIVVAFTPRCRKVIFPATPAILEMQAAGTLLDTILRYDENIFTKRPRAVPAKGEGHVD